MADIAGLGELPLCRAENLAGIVERGGLMTTRDAANNGFREYERNGPDGTERWMAVVALCRRCETLTRLLLDNECRVSAVEPVNSHRLVINACKSVRGRAVLKALLDKELMDRTPYQPKVTNRDGECVLGDVDQAGLDRTSLFDFPGRSTHIIGRRQEGPNTWMGLECGRCALECIVRMDGSQTTIDGEPEYRRVNSLCPDKATTES